jgi:hypothetical protein
VTESGWLGRLGRGSLSSLQKRGGRLGRLREADDGEMGALVFFQGKMEMGLERLVLVKYKDDRD